MQLQFGFEYKKYVSTQRVGDPRSNRLLSNMVKKGSNDEDGRLRARPACCSNKENTPLMLPNIGSANIDKIMQYIEGGPQNEAAYKKAQKKARQKQKKEDERRQKEEEEEALQKAEEERLQRERQLAEQQRVREELALQKQLKKLQQNQKKKGQHVQQQNANEGKAKKKKGKEQVQQVTQNFDPDPEPELFEQTIPAMVTIKRIVENNNSPALVTITLKGSTPDQDKLLYTLVNGHDAPITTPKCPLDSKQQQQQGNRKQTKQSNDKQKKNNGSANTCTTNININKNNVQLANSSKTKKKDKGNVSAYTSIKQVQTSEIKVQLAVDSSFRKDVAKLKEQAQKMPEKPSQPQVQQPVKQKQQTGNNNSNTSKKLEVKSSKEVKKMCSTSVSSSSSSSLSSPQEILDIPSIKLPPGITITKVRGPLTNRKSSAASTNDYPDVPVSKSGVIVVDTEKLIQQQAGPAMATGTSKKKKKKAKKAAAAAGTGTGSEASSTLQNGCEARPRVLIQSSIESKTGASCSSGMVNLKNPIFHPVKPTPTAEMPNIMNMNEQATISQGENGMVTIRRPRPVGFMPAGSNESSIAEYLAQTAGKSSPASITGGNMTASVITAAPSSVKRVPHAPAAPATSAPSNPPILTPWQMPDTLTEDRKIIRPPSPRGVQWSRSDCENGKITTASVLQGLPGIEITRVRTGSPIIEPEYVEAPANVSISRTNAKKNWAYSAHP